MDWSSVSKAGLWSCPNATWGCKLVFALNVPVNIPAYRGTSFQSDPLKGDLNFHSLTPGLVHTSFQSVVHSDLPLEGSPPRWSASLVNGGCQRIASSPLHLTMTSGGPARPPARLPARCYCSLRSLSTGGDYKTNVACGLDVGRVAGGGGVHPTSRMKLS